jgi:uncharacterized protein (DUF58 family)
VRDAFQGLTTRGRSFVAAGIAVLVAAAASAADDLLRIAVLLLALPVVSALVVSRTRYRLSSGRRLWSPRTAAGQESAVTLRLDNISRLPTGLLLVEDRVPYVLGSRPRFVLDRVEPRGRREVTYTVRSDVRGRYQLGPLSIRLTDPFGMCELTRSFSSRDTLVVTPPVQELPLVPLTGEWTGSGESRSRSLASAGEDDAGTREYRQGDDLRRVHWRSTARRGELMVRREEQPWQSRATLVLDRRRIAHEGNGGGSSFEWAVSAVASVASHLVDRGYAVRLVDGSGDAAHTATPWVHDAGQHGDVSGTAVLDALATVEQAGPIELQRAVRAASRAATGGLVVAVLGRIDEADATLLAPLNQPGTSCVAILAPTADIPPAVPAPGAPVGAAANARLRAAGWDVVPAMPGEGLADTWSRVGAGRTVTVGGRR